MTAGLSLLRGRAPRSPQLLLWVCGLTLVRAAVPALQPAYLMVPGTFLLLDFAVLAVITGQVAVLRRRGERAGAGAPLDGRQA